MSRPDIRAALHAKGFRPDGPDKMVRLSDESLAGFGTLVRELAKAKPAIRVPRARIPNKTEARYGDILRVRYQEPHVVLYEPLSFRLNSGASYCPDWIVFEGPTIIAAWEVKGAWGHHSHSRSALAWKTCAQEWPMILWGWAKWANLTDGWLETEIPPERRANL